MTSETLDTFWMASLCIFIWCTTSSVNNSHVQPHSLHATPEHSDGNNIMLVNIRNYVGAETPSTASHGWTTYSWFAVWKESPLNRSVQFVGGTRHSILDLSSAIRVNVNNATLDVEMSHLTFAWSTSNATGQCWQLHAWGVWIAELNRNGRPVG